MTREKASRYAPLLEAYGLGKDIQIKMSSGWEDIKDPGFNNEDPSVYRIKPEPQLMGWRMEEVPVGARIRQVGGDLVSVILSANLTSVFADFYAEGRISRLSVDLLAKNYVFSTDNGKTWKPCGVEL